MLIRRHSSRLRFTASLLLFSALACAQLTITTSSVPTVTQYQSYNTQLAATGGTPPYTWSVVQSTGISLPEGMSLNPSTGVVSASQVNGQGGYGVTIQVTDSASPSSNVATAVINFGVYADSSYAGCQMFPADNIYNQRIDLLPVDTNPAHQIPSAYLSSPIHPDFGHGFYPSPEGGIPFMRVPANQPLATVNLAGNGQIDGPGTFSWPVPTDPVIEATAYGLDTWDHHVLLLQTSVNNITGTQTGPCTLYEMYSSVFGFDPLPHLSNMLPLRIVHLHLAKQRGLLFDLCPVTHHHDLHIGGIEYFLAVFQKARRKSAHGLYPGKSPNNLQAIR